MNRSAPELETLDLLDEWGRQEVSPADRGVDDQRGVCEVAAALRRVSRRDELARRRHWSAFAVASAVALLALTVGGLRLWTSPSATLELATSGDSVVRAVFDADAVVVDQEGRRLEAGAAVEPGGGLIARSGEARVEFPSGAEVITSGTTSLRVARFDDAHETIALSRGRITVEVPPRGSSRTFSVQTPGARVVVHGTRFQVDVRPQAAGGGTSVAVERGVVAVHVDGLEVARLTAGQSWSSRPLPQSAPAPADEARGRASESELRPGRTRSRPASRRVARARTGRALPESTLASDNRLFAAAMARKRAGDAAGALRLFERFISRQRGSVLLQEALVERFRLLRRLGRQKEAQRRARHYLSSYPSGFAREEARSLLGAGE